MKLVTPPAAQARVSCHVSAVWLAEVGLVVDHARQQLQSAGVDCLFAGPAVEIAGNRCDAAVLHMQVGVETAAFIDELAP